MSDGVTPDLDDAPALRRFAVTPVVEVAVLAIAIAIAVASAVLVARDDSPRLLTPPLVALLLVGNLLPGVAVLVLLGRRIARRRAQRSPIGHSGRLHVRLVAMFSMAAAIPMVLVTVAASLLFQYGVEFWYSDKARGILENAASLARENYANELARVNNETLTMRGDLLSYLRDYPIDDPRFQAGLAFQLLNRNLSEGVIVRAGDKVPLAMVNPYERPLDRVVTPALVAKLQAGAESAILQTRTRAGVVVPLDRAKRTYLYAARVFDPQLAGQLRRGETIVADYRALQARSRALQLRFNAALLALSLLIVGIAVWAALTVADRLVRPVGELVGAARRVADGDLTARVDAPRRRDEVGVLARAFNQMTARLQQQNAALETRRALIEAVMSGVSAGVISVDPEGTVRIINRSALALLGATGASPVGRPLAELAPELARELATGAREAIVEVQSGTEARTLAVRIARADAGPILTFDDITQQLTDQRRAAWADVARRIAHEIKNPLTPIQLAAERLQRRYGRTVEPGDTTFARLTDTIVRQVGDLRRMVDEFSSFARMPKPTFRPEPLADLVRQALFLHEVAHPHVRFQLAPGPEPVLVCDRRQIGQALTNIVKNAVEAIDATGRGEGSVTARVAEAGGRLTVSVADDGVGLPADRERIVEPYVTTRARGTGLGLAIVKKIVEEHGGTIEFADREEGGTLVTMQFDAAMLARLAGDDGEGPEAERPLAEARG
jgi:two-component system, NtrC family, nitrogen regulation sensor histidine kinase NtrY